MSSSEQEDVFDQGGYNSDEDKEWLPSENNEKTRYWKFEVIII